MVVNVGHQRWTAHRPPQDQTRARHPSTRWAYARPPQQRPVHVHPPPPATPGPQSPHSVLAAPHQQRTSTSPPRQVHVVHLHPSGLETRSRTSARAAAASLQRRAGCLGPPARRCSDTIDDRDQAAWRVCQQPSSRSTGKGLETGAARVAVEARPMPRGRRGQNAPPTHAISISMTRRYNHA